MMHHRINFGYKMFGASEDLVRTDSQATLGFMVMYHKTTFDCDRINITGDTVIQSYVDYINPHCHPVLEDSTPTFPNYTPPHDDEPLLPSLVPNKKFKKSVIQEISSKKTLTDISNFCCDLELNAAI